MGCASSVSWRCCGSFTYNAAPDFAEEPPPSSRVKQGILLAFRCSGACVVAVAGMGPLPSPASKVSLSRGLPLEHEHLTGVFTWARLRLGQLARVAKQDAHDCLR